MSSLSEAKRSLRKRTEEQLRLAVLSEIGRDEPSTVEPYKPEGGRLWIESWHFGIRDAEMRADALRDNTAWRRLVAEVVRRGIELGTFGGRYDPDKIAVLTIAAVDGMGIPLSLADPEITAASAAQDVMTALRDMLSPGRVT